MDLAGNSLDQDDTTLGELAEGAGVHLESDVIGKYVRSLVAPFGTR